MNKSCRLLYNHSDFTSFSRLHSGAKSNICKIYSAIWEESDNRLVFTIKADRFLRNMVRAIVGTMIEIGFGKMDAEDLKKLFMQKTAAKPENQLRRKDCFWWILNIRKKYLCNRLC